MSDWTDWTAAVFRGTSLGVDEWRLDAELVGVSIVGGFAMAGPGVLRSPNAFAPTIRTAMTRAQAPAPIADAVASTIWQAWKQWADGVTVPSLFWYPSFAAFPGPVAPPTPNVPSPLVLCVSKGLPAMSAASLGPAMLTALGTGPLPAGTREAVDRLADALGDAFRDWIAHANVSLVFGAGSAAVASPLIPVAPVTGSVINNGRGCLAAAVPFPSRAPSNPV